MMQLNIFHSLQSRSWTPQQIGGRCRSGGSMPDLEEEDWDRASSSGLGAHQKTKCCENGEYYQIMFSQNDFTYNWFYWIKSIQPCVSGIIVQGSTTIDLIKSFIHEMLFLTP